MSKNPIIGVLALQGAVDLHRPHVEAGGAAFRTVKTPTQFEEVDGFILPGGESTTMLKLIERFDLWDALAAQFSKKPVWGICAGSILMAQTSFRTNNRMSRDAPSNVIGVVGQKKETNNVSGIASSGHNNKTQKSFGLLPIMVQRNGYGPQNESHTDEIEGYSVSFIRAPVIVDAGDCDVLASHQGRPAWVQKGYYIASTFHPELTLDFPSPMHTAFIDLVKAA